VIKYSRIIEWLITAVVAVLLGWLGIERHRNKQKDQKLEKQEQQMIQQEKQVEVYKTFIEQTQYVQEAVHEIAGEQKIEEEKIEASRKTLRTSLLLPTILCLVLTLAGCESTEQVSKIEIPSFNMAKPVRPGLIEIPSDPTDAIKVLTTNLSRMDGYIRQLEIFVEHQELFFKFFEK